MIIHDSISHISYIDHHPTFLSEYVSSRIPSNPSVSGIHANIAYIGDIVDINYYENTINNYNHILNIIV